MNVDNINIDDVINMLDGLTQKEVSRIKILTDENVSKDAPIKQHHHGRCDIGSPWACGEAFDVLE